MEGWERLYSDYWKPVYAYLRRSGRSHADSEDLCQMFFYHLYTSDWPAKADPSKGRFRNFLIKTLKFFLSNSVKKEKAQKRGGHITFASFDTFESFLDQNSPTLHGDDPSTVFDKVYALDLIEKSNFILSQEYEEKGEAQIFSALSQLGPKGRSPESVAEEFNLSVKAVEMRKSRMNLRRREIFRELIKLTVASKEEVEEEILYLRKLLNH